MGAAQAQYAKMELSATAGQKKELAQGIRELENGLNSRNLFL